MVTGARELDRLKPRVRAVRFFCSRQATRHSERYRARLVGALPEGRCVEAPILRLIGLARFTRQPPQTRRPCQKLPLNVAPECALISITRSLWSTLNLWLTN